MVTNKYFVIRQFVEKHNFDFLFLTETWLNSDYNVVLNETSLSGFRFLYVPRMNKKGGGVACLCCHTYTLCSKQISLGKFVTFEYLAMHLGH